MSCVVIIELCCCQSTVLFSFQVNILYLNYDNRLQDCKDVDDTRMSDDEVIMDYKTHSKRRVQCFYFHNSVCMCVQCAVNLCV